MKHFLDQFRKKTMGNEQQPPETTTLGMKEVIDEILLSTDQIRGIAKQMSFNLDKLVRLQQASFVHVSFLASNRQLMSEDDFTQPEHVNAIRQLVTEAVKEENIRLYERLEKLRGDNK